VYERDHDGEGYRTIADRFAQRGFDLRVDLSSFAPAWPVRAHRRALLDRVGTPILLETTGY
jgi:hypothetical protein